MRLKMRQLRKERGISQTFLAQKLGYKHTSGYANIEMGRNNLTLEKAIVIADVLGVNIKELAEEKSDNFFSNDLHKMRKTSA